MKITLWNSIAKRRRSISDTFYDNGLATLKGYLEDKGHQVEVIDWARDDFFQALSPRWLTKSLRALYGCMMKSKSELLKQALGLISMQLQAILSAIQEKRLTMRLDNLAHELKEKNVRVFGIKVWYGEAFKNAKYLIQRLKEIAPDMVTIAGGYHVTLYEEFLMENSGFDLGVACEGEYALEQILQIAQAHQDYWNKGKVLEEIITAAQNDRIENLLYRLNGKVYKARRREIMVFSSKSIPRYTIDDNKVRVHVMVESLGCDWGKCHFCVHPHFYPHYSLRSPDEIIAEMEVMLKTGIGVFRFAGSDTPPTFGARIAHKIKERNLKVIFGMGSRPIHNAKVQTELLTKAYASLIESGLRSVFMGGETGNDVINVEVMNKGVTSEDIVYTIKALRAAEKKTGQKVYLSLALIYPMPLLGKVTLRQVKEDNIRLLQEAMPDSVMITPPGPFLHTKWYLEQDRFGFKVDKDIIAQAMEYEYVLYKPPQFWPRLGISLEGRPFKTLLAECNELRTIVERQLHIPTDISDEHSLMFFAAGIRGNDELLKAKNDTMIDIVSCDYATTSDISKRVNTFSSNLAAGLL